MTLSKMLENKRKGKGKKKKKFGIDLSSCENDSLTDGFWMTVEKSQKSKSHAN